MQADLALLPLWYAEPGDYVFTESLSDLTFLNQLPSGFIPSATPVTTEGLSTQKDLPQLDVRLWGLTPHHLRYFENLKEKKGCRLNVPRWNPEYRELVGRQTAAECLESLRLQLADYKLPQTPLFCNSIGQIEVELGKSKPPFILKTPYSSSGRGLLWIRNSVLAEKETEWITGALNKQGYVSIESGLRRIQDFALEFHIDEKGKAKYEGLSVFDTTNKGTYTGNHLRTQEALPAMLTGHDPEVFNRIKDTLCKQLERVFGGIYSGYLGVDMMLYQDDEHGILIHPCVEINVRNTMGMVAVCLYRNYVFPSATGSFIVSHEANTFECHKEMAQKYPPVITGGRIAKGYISLCPVTPETRYRAYILIQ